MGLFDKYLQRYGCQERSQSRSTWGFSTNISKDMGAKKDPKAGAKGAPTKNPKKKEGGGGGKVKKKKWSKGKTRDKLNNLVLFDKPTYEKLLKEVPTYKLIPPSIVSERLKVRGSLARKALIELQEKGLIKQVVQHHAQTIYTRNVVEGETETA